MSATSNTAPPGIAPNAVAGPWRKALIALCVVAGIGATFILFTGRVPYLHKSAPTERPVEVQMNASISPLDRPKEASAAAATPASLPPVARPAVVNKLTTGAGGMTERQKALESGVSAYTIAPNTGAAPPTKRAGGAADDPDDIPTGGKPDALEASLAPTRIEGTRVSELPDPRWLIEQGRVLPCTQQTKINSTLPGAVTAIIPEEIRGETGDVVVMPKGARVFGTIQHSLTNGLDRLAVLWQNITTPVLYDGRGMPHQFRVAVNSPASSELGETGLDGDVDHHYVKKIGGILGLSLIQGAIQYGVAKAQNQGQGNTTLNLDSFQSGGNDAANELLRAWINIPDVMTRNQGSACGIYVVRDLDMRGAYKLTQKYRSGL